MRRIRDTKVEDEANESSYLNTVIPGTGNPAAGGPGETYRERRNREANEAFRASQERQEQMQKARSEQKEHGKGRTASKEAPISSTREGRRRGDEQVDNVASWPDERGDLGVKRKRALKHQASRETPRQIGKNG